MRYVSEQSEGDSDLGKIQTGVLAVLETTLGLIFETIDSQPIKFVDSLHGGPNERTWNDPKTVEPVDTVITYPRRALR